MVVVYSNTWKPFFENGIPISICRIGYERDQTNSGMVLIVDDVIANLKGHEDEFDALVFSPVEMQYLYSSSMQTSHTMWT